MTDPIDPVVRHSLRHHPGTPCAAVDEIVVEVCADAPGALAARWSIAGDLERLRIPAPGAALHPDRLWAHTCCEMFVAPADAEAYVEWNFSPTGQVACFEFSGYRRRRPSSVVGAATSSVAVDAGILRVQARAPLPSGIGPAVRVSLTAVIEDATGALSYWALRHPADRPDFHHRGGFALALHLGPHLP